jgi:serine/threonine protein kinase
VKRTSRREVSLLRTLQHPNVVGFLDEFLVRDRLFIVMEFVPCNLLELLEAQPGGMDREAVRLIMYQASGRGGEGVGQAAAWGQWAGQRT